MIYFTYASLKEKVKDDLDLQDELFITDREMMGYANSGIDEAESEVHTIYEDYFLTETTLPLVLGEHLIDLPTNMYAMKIREMVYKDGASTVYEVRRLHGYDRLELQTLTEKYQTTDWYQYYIINPQALTVSDVPKIRLVPQSRVDLPNGLIVQYLRNANRMIDDDSVCDIPEFSQFVIQYMKVKCYEKEGHPNLEVARVDLEKYRTLMRDTLSHMVPDGDNKVPMDLSYYDESS